MRARPVLLQSPRTESEQRECVGILQQARSRAKQVGREFRLTADDIPGFPS
jgi:hypothetical protein